ncbi:MAG: hypothetical protein ACK4N5_03125, partial [Myxococcales bacterium]
APPPNGTALCAAGSCTFECNAGYYRCGSGCCAFSLATVDSAGDVGMYASLALDATGAPHIAYYDATNQDLKYARLNGTVWSLETVDSLGSVGHYATIAIGPLGRPSIAYYDATNRALKYAWHDGSSWRFEWVDLTAGKDVGTYASLGVDATGTPHISYYNATDADLMYAKKVGSSWQLETVASSSIQGSFTSLRIDAAGLPRIAFIGWDNVYRIRSATPGTSGWTITNLQQQYCDQGYLCSVRGWTSHAIDSAGGSHVAWTYQYAFASSNPNYAYYGYYTPPTGSPRSFAYVHPNQLNFVSLALEPDDTPNVVWVDASKSTINLARLINGTFSSKAFDTAKQFGYPSIAFDAQGRPHVAYYDATNRDLRYAR